MRSTRSFWSRFLIIVLSLLLLLPMAACSVGSSGTSVSKIADFGTYGSELALKLADDYPNRSPGSDQETAAREFLVDAFKDLGYKSVIQDFTFSNSDGESIPSANIIVRVSGDGVSVTDKDGKTTVERRQVIIGANYDVSVTEEQAREAAAAAAASEAATAESEAATASESEANEPESGEETSETIAEMPVPTLADFDGIHANASGIGALFTVARQLKRVDLDYDVLLIAFGAGTAGQAGAKAYAFSMNDEDIAKTDAMYNIDGIYAGDDMYVHAGQNSVLPGNQKIYEKRRKLYEATDVFFEYALYSNNRYNLNTNQSSLNVEFGENGETAIYREWSLHRSNHTPFDQAGIPIVFFESFDYDYDTLIDMKESKNPALSITGGAVRDTPFDSTAFLQYLFANTTARESTDREDQAEPIDRLEQRINNTAFVIVEAVKRRVAETVETSRN